jgi:hypothetical protein
MSCGSLVIWNGTFIEKMKKKLKNAVKEAMKTETAKQTNPRDSKLFRFCRLGSLIFKIKWCCNSTSFHFFKSRRNKVDPTFFTRVANRSTYIPLNSGSPVDTARTTFRAGFDFNDLIRI